MKQQRLTTFRPYLEGLEARLTLSGPGANLNPGILPPQSHALGASASEWSARWWQWAYSLPIDHHPLYDTAPVSTGQPGKVWFLGGSFSATTTPTGETVAIDTRTVTIPTGKALFFPILNSEASTVEGSGSTFAELSAAAKSFQDAAANMSAQIDGAPVQDVNAYRVQTPLFTFGPLPDHNVLQALGTNAPAGTTSRSVGDGVYLMLAPLSAGQHTIHFHGEAPAFNFLLDITYNLTVVGGQDAKAAGAADQTQTADPGIAPPVAQAPGTAVGVSQVTASAPPQGGTASNQGPAGLVTSLPLPGTGAAVGTAPVMASAPQHGATFIDDPFAPPWGPALVGAW
jgi:hypothetical protein